MKHRKILTNSERAKRRMTNDESCTACENVQETVLHALRDCKVATDVWLKVISADSVSGFFWLNMEDWLSANIRG